MAQAADLIIVFLALELLSIPLYVLSAFARPISKSEEAGIKYFLLGAFATGFVVYRHRPGLWRHRAPRWQGFSPWSPSDYLTLNTCFCSIGAALLLVGFGFKVAAVPFHMWTPDVYQGAPTSVTAFMAVGAKAAGFAALLRIFVTALPSLDCRPDSDPVGSGRADHDRRQCRRHLADQHQAYAGLLQHRPRRLHPDGFRCRLGIRRFASDAVASAFFYLVTYAVTSFGAWAAGHCA